MRDYLTLHINTKLCKGTRETIQNYTSTQNQVKEHERLFNITHQHKIK